MGCVLAIDPDTCALIATYLDEIRAALGPEKFGQFQAFVQSWATRGLMTGAR